MAFWYISFATDHEFLGGTIVAAETAGEALTTATSLGLNPGGEAAIASVPDPDTEWPEMKPLLNRLASRSELMALGATRHGDLSPEERAWFEDNCEIIWEACNVISD